MVLGVWNSVQMRRADWGGRSRVVQSGCSAASTCKNILHTARFAIRTWQRSNLLCGGTSVGLMLLMLGATHELYIRSDLTVSVNGLLNAVRRNRECAVALTDTPKVGRLPGWASPCR